MAILFVKRMKMTLLVAVMLLPASVWAQDNMPEALSNTYFAKQAEAGSIAHDIDVAEREVYGYDKVIKQNRKLQSRMKDKAHRLKYKVMRELSKMDTTAPHKTTYTEWKLIKTEKERERAAMQLAKAEQSRQEKVLYLGKKTDAFHQALADMQATVSASRDDIRAKNPNTKTLKLDKKAKKYKRTREPRYDPPR